MQTGQNLWKGLCIKINTKFNSDKQSEAKHDLGQSVSLHNNVLLKVFSKYF